MKKWKIFQRIRDKEYSKRLLSKITNHCIWMMWATYILAWFGKTEIAESLSKTIVTSIIAVVIGYLAKSAFENISKYTTAFGENYQQAAEDKENKEDEIVNDDPDCL